MNRNFRGKVAIIGAGPTGYTAALAALKLGFEVELIDPWIFAKPDLNAEVKLKVKSRFGSTVMHDYPNKYLSSNGNQNLAASSVVGGFTTIWGAGLSFETSVFEIMYEPRLIDEAEETVRDIFKNFLGSHFISKRFIKLLDPKRGFLPSQLAVSGSRCTLKGQCMSGCTQEAIWSCEQPWVHLISTEVTLRKGFATKIEETTNQVLVHTNFENQIKVERYDFVLVACGAIASVSLGQRSGILPVDVELGETGISYIPLLIVNQLKPYKERNFTLSQVFYDKKIPKENRKMWLSLFEASDFLKQQARLKLNWMSKLIPNVLWGYLGVAIHYKPETLSKKILIKLQNGVSIVSSVDPLLNSKSYFKSLFRSIRKDFYLSGLLFHPSIRLNGKSCDSYHIGHLTSKGEEILDISGKARMDSKVAFVDSTSLNKLPPGPITAIAMMNSYLKTSLVLNKTPN